MTDNLNDEIDFEVTEITMDRATTDRYVSDTKDRKWLSKWAAIVVSGWLLGVYVLITWVKVTDNLSDGVLIALITTTTINILGLPIVVLLNLFPKPIK